MSEKKTNEKDDFLAQEAKEEAAQAAPYTLDIPEDEIWTYQIDGLQTPRIGKPIRNFRRKKIIVVLVLLVAIGLAIFFSLRAVHSELFAFERLDDGTAALTKFSNNGTLKELTVAFADDGQTPVSAIRDFAFNCDEKLTEIQIGKTVTDISPTAFYSCWALQTIKVDPDNPAYCDIDGVLYTKDCTRVVCYPIDRDRYLREKYGYTDLKDENGKPMDELWGPTATYDAAFFEQYNRDVRTYVLPATVKVIGATALNYANLTALYLPEGLEEIETMALFKCTSLETICSYTGEPAEDAAAVTDGMQTLKSSLPDSLVSIGSDAFTGDQALSYLYLPAAVTFIGHHAFWDTCYKQDGEMKGITEIHTALGEDAFRTQTTLGDQWRPQMAGGLLPKNVPVRYGAERENLYGTSPES